MSDSEFDFVVVGAGIVGSWTAKHLKKHGNVLLLEQFREPHTRGSSHGQSRLTRTAYEEPFFADMMPHATEMWRQLEKESNETIMVTTGVLCIADSPENKDYVDAVNNMKRLCPESLEELRGKDINSKYPTTLKYDEKCAVLLDKTGGVLFAHKAVRTVQQLFQKSGGTFWDGCKVTEIKPMESTVKVVTSRGDVFGKTVVVTSGCWTKQLLSSLAPSLPLQPKAVKVYYWKEKTKGAYSASSGFPCTLNYAPYHIYSLPSLEYPGLMKICVHYGVPCNPDERDKAVGNEAFLDSVKDHVKKHFPLLEPEPAIVETCMYTCTPDEIFLIDTLPKHKNIVIGTGFSGIGFKTSPIVGRLLSELATGVDPILDLSPYRLSRFSDMKK